MAKLHADLVRVAKLARQAARQRSLEQGESGWGSPVVPPPVIPERVGDPCRVVVVGAGIQGGVLARGVSMVEGAEVAALVDLDLDKARRVLDPLGVGAGAAYDDAATAFSETRPDLAVIATTAPSHIALGRAALDAGVGRILLEKPIGVSYGESQRFVEQCAQDGTYLAVDYVRRWLLGHQAVLAAVHSGQIGTPRILTAQVGGGELAMHGSHFVDLFRMFTGAEVAEVSAQLRPTGKANVRGAEYDDPTGHLQLRFDTGARAYIDFEPDLRSNDVVVTLRGDDGLIVIEEHQNVWTLRSSSGRIWTFPFAEPFAPKSFATRAIVAALTEETPACSGADGLAALEVVLAAHHSNNRDGLPVPLPLSDEERALEVSFP